jgi:3-demethoxyubiquinol 3-hydroxylase
MKRKIAKSKKAAPSYHLPGTPSVRKRLEHIIRVNHAGEFGAQRIYAGQLAVLGEGSTISAALHHMAKQEDKHLAAFEKLIVTRKVRPTALYPLWHVVGYALGVATATLGSEAAMACTVAVEETIEEHYQKQLEYLADDERALKSMIKKFRDEEIEHKNIGLKNNAEDLAYYPILRALIRAGSKTAIWLSERI